MKWERVSSVAEILSSVAIVATLIYLVVQTQQNTLATQANSRQATASLVMSALSTQTENPEIWVRQYEPDLRSEEKAYFHAWLVQFFVLRQLDWTNYRNGTLDEASWESNARSIEPVLANPTFRRWWRNFGRSQFDPSLVQYVDTRIKDSELNSDNPMVTSFD